jgi:hypothetical protein
VAKSAISVAKKLYHLMFEMFYLHDHTALHYDCSIIAADLLKHRMTGMPFLWRLILNTMIAILACTLAAIQGSEMSQTHAWRTLRWPAAQQWWRALVAMQQWWRPRSSTACHNFQHAAPGCSPVNLRQIPGKA